MLREIVGDLKPRCLFADEDVLRWADAEIIVKDTQGNPELVYCVGIAREAPVIWAWTVYDWGAAISAEAPAKAGRGFIIPHKLFALEPLEILNPDPSAAAERCPVLLSALHAMAVQRLGKRPRDFEFDTTA